MAKFKIGDKVKWNDGKYHNDNKRIDVITKITKNLYGDICYFTKEINNKEGTKAKIGKAHEAYLIKV